jgi:hypothetical protein
VEEEKEGVNEEENTEREEYNDMEVRWYKDDNEQSKN